MLCLLHAAALSQTSGEVGTPNTTFPVASAPALIPTERAGTGAGDLVSLWAAPHRGDVRAVLRLPAHLCTGTRTRRTPFCLLSQD